MAICRWIWNVSAWSTMIIYAVYLSWDFLKMSEEEDAVNISVAAV